MLILSPVSRVIGNPWSICLGINIVSPSTCVTSIGNIPLLKALRVNSRPS